jgi:hypothetical protein
VAAALLWRVFYSLLTLPLGAITLSRFRKANPDVLAHERTRRPWHDRSARCGGPVVPNDDQTNEKEPATMKLTTATNVSVDGVMQGLGGPDEDRRGGFERGGAST